MHEPIWNPLAPTASLLGGEARPGMAWAWVIRSTSVAVPTAAVRREGHTRSPALQRLEAALFVAEGSLTARKLMQFAALPSASEIPELIDQLNLAYEASSSSFRVERLATGYQLMTRPIFARWLDKIHERQARLKLSPPAMETLTIVAYRQPLTRADLEEVRGVQSTEILKQLMERGLVKIVGEHDSLGRPYLYGTTRLFLESFGVSSLAELPLAETLRRPTNAPAVESTPESEHAA
jgi:segregation and condensation protein B